MQKCFAYSNKKISIFLLFSFIISTISTPILAIQQEAQAKLAPQPQEEKIFQTIANGYLKSFDQIVAPQPELTLEDLAKNNEKAAIQKVELGEAEKRQIAFAMLSSQSAHKDTVVGPVIDKTFLNKMEILAGGEHSKNSLFNQINRTETVFGEITLARWLSQPLTDKNALEDRQRMVQELISNQELFNILDAYVKRIKQAQSNTFVYWKAESKINEELYKKLFFGSWFNRLNKSSVALEFGTRLDNLAKMGLFFEAPTIVGLAALNTGIHYGASHALNQNKGSHNLSEAQKKEFSDIGIDITKEPSIWRSMGCGFKHALGRAKKFVQFIFDPRLHKNDRMKSYLDGALSDVDRGMRWAYSTEAKLALENKRAQHQAMKILWEKTKGSEEFWKVAEEKGYTLNTIYAPNYATANATLYSMPDLFAHIDATFDAQQKYAKEHNYETISPETAQKIAFGLKGASVALVTALVLYKGYTTKQLADEEILRQSAANNIHGHMIGVATYVDAIKNLHKTILAQPAFASLAASPAFAQLSGSNNTVTNNFNELLALLDHNTFKGSPSFFSLTGRVLAAHQIMKEVKNEMVPAFELAGELDAYLSVAKLYKEFADKRVQYSFAQYMTADKPYFKVEGFWNPMVNHQVVVANDFALGSDAKHPANALVTGPNTGGKSTVLKGILLNLLLAQTLTITPAQNLTFTPYTKINCYLNVTDDIGAGTSLFKAEVLRAKALINAIRGLTQGQFSFTIMDEMFSGTSPKEGEEAAYMFAEQLGEFDASMLLIATHFPLLTHLEDKTTRFKNYQVTVIKDENGKLHRPYKLEEGKSFLNIAMDLLKEEGVL